MSMAFNALHNFSSFVFHLSDDFDKFTVFLEYVASNFLHLFSLYRMTSISSDLLLANKRTRLFFYYYYSPPPPPVF